MNQGGDQRPDRRGAAPENVNIVPEAPRYIDRRRKGKDLLTKIIFWLSIFSWILVIVMYFIVGFAAPLQNFWVSNYLKEDISHGWNYAQLWISVYVLAASLVLCIFGIIFNMMRHKRKTDKYRKSLFIAGGISLIGIIILLILIMTS